MKQIRHDAVAMGTGTAMRGRAVRRIASSLVAAGLLFSATLPLRAQVVNFRHYTNADGLPQAQVLSLRQDRLGYMWFATYGGISRFNGNTFETWTQEDGLVSNSVTDVVEDREGRLLIATSGGFCFMHRGEFECYRQKDGLASDNARTVAPDTSGGAWVGTTRGLSFVHNGRIRNFTLAEGLPGDHVLRVAVDSTGGVWVATDRGLARLEGERFVVQFADVLGEGSVSFVVATPAGLLVGKRGALFRIVDSQIEEIAPGQIPAGAVLVDAAWQRDGVIWIATQGGGALRIRNGRVESVTRVNGLLTDLLTRVIIDREGDVWFGTESGASKHVPGPFSTFTTEDGLPNAFVRAIASDSLGRIWAGTRDGIAVLDGPQFTKVELPGVPEQRVYALARSPQGGMLVGTRIGLVWRNGRSTRLFTTDDGLPASVVYCLQPDGEGVWIGTNQGLARFENGRIRRFEHPQISNLSIISMALDARGRLWLGRITGGIAILDGDSVTYLGPARGVTDQTVWSLELDRQGRMWAGTNGHGVLRFDGNEIRRFTMADGLTSNFIWQVLADSRGDIWLYGNLGLNRIRGDEVSQYDRESGLIELEGSANAVHEDENGNLWFGTGSGIVRYAPELGVRPSVRPPIYIEEMLHDGRRVRVSGERVVPEHRRPEDVFHERFRSEAGVRLPRGIIVIRFSSPSFRDESALQYRYRLVGASAEWSQPTRERSITYAGLAPGRYRFEVKAINDAGESETAAVLPFTVQPAFWQTWWFRLLAAMAVLALVAGAPILRARALEHERQRLEALVAQHTRDLADKNARLEQSNRDLEHFAYVASHDLQEPLRKIQAFSDRVTKQYAAALDDTGRDYLARMNSAASRMQRLIEDLLQLSRVTTRRNPIQPLDLNALVQEVVGDLEFRIQSTNGRVEVGNLPVLHGDPVQIRQIFQNLIGNALKFHRPDVPPVVRVNARPLDGQFVELCVEDNGIGFEPKDAERVFLPFQRLHARTQYEGTGIGLTICQKIAERHGGTIRAESAPGQGSRFFVTLPVHGPLGEKNVA